MTTKQAQEFVSKKIVKLRNEGYSERQAVAIALEIARHEGYKVPSVSPGTASERMENV